MTAECTCEYDPFQCTVTHDRHPIDGQMTIDDAIGEELSTDVGTF